jgi:hypothetical protein
MSPACVPDPRRFYTDPDLRIRTSGLRIRTAQKLAGLSYGSVTLGRKGERADFTVRLRMDILWSMAIGQTNA